MILGIFLASGDSFTNLAKSGQDDLFKSLYIKPFSKEFSKIYIFSYDNEMVKNLPKNVHLIGNKFNLHRLLYSLLLPLFQKNYIKKCDAIRAYHLSGVTPAIVSKILFKKPFVFNYAYDYQKFAQIEGKRIQFFLFRIIEPIAFKFADKIFAANKSIFNKVPHPKAVLLPNGVDTNLFKPTKSKILSKPPVVLSVGRLEEQKNFTLLIKSISSINTNLIIIGKGTLKKELLSIAKKLKIKLNLIERVSHSEMAKFYRDADLYISPSITEGSPKAVLEAMSCGLPVIASRNEGTIGIIENFNNGLLVEGNSDRKLADAIKLILRDQKLRKKLSFNARKTIENRFNLSVLIKQEINEIQHLK